MAHYRSDNTGAGPSTSAGPSMLVAAYHAEQQPIPLAPRPYPDGTAPVFRACASAMQQPTLTHVRIRSTRDANQIFYAVARNLLPMTVRRLDAEERRAIVTGNVYVWEERGSSTEATGLGIERWTDGMRWSPSRVRDEFLFYHQKEVDPDEAADLPPTRYARVMRPKASSSDGSLSDASPQEPVPAQRPGAASDPERLIKQTYSVIVALPDDIRRGLLRKWHLTAYFTQASVDSLKTVDEMLPGGSRVPVPDGWFSSARTGKARRDTTRQKQYAFARTLGVEVSTRVPPTIMESGPSGVGGGAPDIGPPSRNLNLGLGGENGPGLQQAGSSSPEERMRVDVMDSSSANMNMNMNMNARPLPPTYNANRPPLGAPPSLPPPPVAGPSTHANPIMGYEYGREYDYDYRHGHGLGHEYKYDERGRMTTSLSYPALPPHERQNSGSNNMIQQEWPAPLPAGMGPTPRPGVPSARQGYGRLGYPPSISTSTSDPSVPSTSALAAPPPSAMSPIPALVAPVSYHTSPSRLASPSSQRERTTTAAAAVHPYAAAYATHVSSRAGSPRGGGMAPPAPVAKGEGAMYSRGTMPMPMSVSTRGMDAGRSQPVFAPKALSLAQQQQQRKEERDRDVDMDMDMDMGAGVDVEMGGVEKEGEVIGRGKARDDSSEEVTVPSVNRNGKEEDNNKEEKEGGDSSVLNSTSANASTVPATAVTMSSTNTMTAKTLGFALPDTPESSPPALGGTVSLPPLPTSTMPPSCGDAKVGLGLGISIAPNPTSSSISTSTVIAASASSSSAVANPNPNASATTTTIMSTTTPQTSPIGRSRALIPLDDLGTVMFPRRDPADDALLRRFRGLRTTPPAQGAE